MTSSATHQHRRLSRIAITAAATALAIGLLTTGSVLYSTNDANAVTTPPLSVLSAALWKPLERLRLCRRRSLIPMVNSFLEPVTGVLDTTPRDRISERSIGVASSAQLVSKRYDARQTVLVNSKKGGFRPPFFV